MEDEKERKKEKEGVCVYVCERRQVLASTLMLGTARFETAPPHYLMQRKIIITIHETHQYKSCIGRDPKALGAQSLGESMGLMMWYSMG